MKTRISLILVAIYLIYPATLFASEADANGSEKSKVNLILSTDVVSANIWRGTYLSGVSVQPSVGFTVEGFTFDVWGSTDFNYGNGGYSEVDFEALYSRWGVTLSLTDYCWTNRDGKFDYFGSYTKNHYLELGASFDFGEYFSKVPISIGGNVMLYGANLTEDGKPAFSTYLSIDYNQPIRNILTLNVSVGAAIERGNACLYSPNNGFSVVNTSVGASRTFDIKGKIDINLGAHLVVNPATEDVNFFAIVGFSL